MKKILAALLCVAFLLQFAFPTVHAEESTSTDVSGYIPLRDVVETTGAP